ncbi:protein of unknown function [Taphrina deformans PYCC 5710]|uniref:Pentatricopeptide repeat protein n=1 Tax=Taphrina deformans (strain PYCC 5710 / ATCC 11124 / CBS 356.35 / IMI 108563 / JCM 9778 / NBRC 8474) TaxID=1097556 RepID=R4XFX4_TAPDE|nr:protein of unknown function [Taphrina deformans PYCC 5710]|eukprot:CCG82274.1 protein of unknown function [Taphrina deformans PYCC 5710]
MRLPRAIAALAGPSTPELQKSFLKDLKQAFRDRVQQRAPPLNSNINDHLQNILQAKSTLNNVTKQDFDHLSAGSAARALYMEGKLTNNTLYDLLGRSTTKHDLDTVRAYALKSGMDLMNQHTNLSARYAARLLHVGCLQDVGHMIEKNTKQWIMSPSAHVVLIQYTCRSQRGFEGARQIFNHLLAHDPENLTTPLVRTMLRESIRANHLPTVTHCLDLDIRSANGQEAGLARWLVQRNEYATAFNVLMRAEPARAKEGSVGLELAQALIESQDYSFARRVLTWVEGRYVLSLQAALRRLEEELQSKRGSRAGSESSRTGVGESHGAAKVQLA